MRLAVAQINPVVGDIANNTEVMSKFIDRAKSEQANLIVFPELALLGYPPKDILLRQEILLQLEHALEETIRPASRELGIILGAPVRNLSSLGCYNSALFYFGGSLAGRQDKIFLSNYQDFDETRYFNHGRNLDPILFDDLKIGVAVGEDAGNDMQSGGSWDSSNHDASNVQELVGKGAELILIIAASPYYFGKRQLRAETLGALARKFGKTVVFVNQTGGNDELVFDGSSLVFDAQGRILWQGRAFEEDFAVIDVPNLSLGDFQVKEGIECIHDALVMGIRDYLHKSGFGKAIIGLSGGLDSAVTAALAANALGSENVLGVAMPSRYSSAGSLKDTRRLAANLGIELREISIEPIFAPFTEIMNESGSFLQDVAEENLQARIRANILMFISNREGHLLLSTGNKSEMAVGYSTLYGDMSGGLSVLGDVLKTTVYELAAYINTRKEIIPPETLSKPPSAELRPNQKDADSLPPYSVLDQLLAGYFEDNLSLEEMVSLGYEPDLVKEIIHKVDRSEHKRRQAPLILRVTDKAFGSGRRFPVAWRRSW